jgi:hypothetical protein
LRRRRCGCSTGNRRGEPATNGLSNAYYDAKWRFTSSAGAASSTKKRCDRVCFVPTIMSLLSLAADFTASVPPTYRLGDVLPVKEGTIEAIIAAFVLADIGERSRASEILSPAAGTVLLGYAREASVRAVREHSPDRVADGLAALAVEDGKLDARDSIVATAMLFRSSELLGMDSAAVFEDASRLVSHRMLKSEMRDFPSRPKKNRDLKAAFFIAEKMTKDRFTYERNHGTLNP